MVVVVDMCTHSLSAAVLSGVEVRPEVTSAGLSEWS